ncbi:class I SAM-dependent methyltransferase [Exiguobacterium acetylicum]|uniref:class I SAM-dependent methyltransferase n=1 Tax=Exiguobacterium acetylicum TaxID=41170 RepID=UPI0039779715
MKPTIGLTTCLRPTEDVHHRVKELLAEEMIHFVYIARKKKGIEQLQQETGLPVLVVDKQRLDLYPFGEKTSFFFHPSSAVFRIKQIDAGGGDPLVAIGRLSEGMRVLDCTLGLGADAIVMSHAVGDSGQLVGLESRIETAYVVKQGLQRWEESYAPINQAMRRIEVRMEHHLAFLKQCPNDSFDVIYFDPMFERTVSESTHLDPLRTLANYEALSAETIMEAKRVASQRIVLKAHYESPLFDQFNFERQRRKTSKLHYGVIEL